MLDLVPKQVRVAYTLITTSGDVINDTPDKVATKHKESAGNDNGSRVITVFSHVMMMYEARRHLARERFEPHSNGHYTDSLACMASTVPTEYRRTVAAKYLCEPSIGKAVEMVLDLDIGPSWMDPIMSYLRVGMLPTDKKETQKIKARSS